MSSINDNVEKQNLDEFQNIDLDADGLAPMEYTNFDDPMQSSFIIANRNLFIKQDDKETPAEESESNITPNPKTNELVPESSNKYLNELSTQMMEDYAKYFQLNPTSQIDELNECIENLLTHMEEFYGLIERIRNQSNSCLDQYQMQLLPKLKECQRLFKFIDKLERIVNHVGMQISLMEQEVSRAEKMMGTKTSTMKKLFSLVINVGTSSSESNTSRYRYVPPDIFKTEELMKM